MTGPIAVMGASGHVGTSVCRRLTTLAIDVRPLGRDDDLGSALRDAAVAALDPRTHHGRFDLPGPDELTMDEFVRIVNGGSASLRHVPALVARALGRTHPGLTPELVDLLLADSRGEQLRAVRTFGLERRRLEDVYGRRAAAAA